MDVYEALETMENIGEELNKVANLIAQAWNQFITPLKDFVEIVNSIKITKKKSYPTVKEIKPNKLIILSKRLNVHYCRNNC